jgi:hypothetical protein
MTQQLGNTRKDALFFVGAAQGLVDRAQTAEKGSHDQRFLLDTALIFSNLATAMATIEANDLAAAKG